jgi:CheY-like chemotaxis protein
MGSTANTPQPAPGTAIMPRILVVEQDLALRTLFCEWLSADGYLVSACPRPEASCDSSVNLVIIDLFNLPSKGVETVRQIKSRCPGALLIGVSTQLSSAISSDSAQAVALGVRQLLPKPCSHDALLHAVIAAVGLPTA